MVNQGVPQETNPTWIGSTAYDFGFTVYSSMQTDRGFLRKFSDNDMETN